jgi:hypothetical protein
VNTIPEGAFLTIGLGLEEVVGITASFYHFKASLLSFCI